MATHSSLLAWEIPWTEDPRGLRVMADLSQRVRQDRVTKQHRVHWKLGMQARIALSLLCRCSQAGGGYTLNVSAYSFIHQEFTIDLPCVVSLLSLGIFW